MSYADDMDGPSEIGGWMYLFLFGFTLATPVLVAYGLYANVYGDPNVEAVLGNNWGEYQIFEWINAAATLAIVAYITWRLFNVRNSQTVWLTIAAIPLLSVGGLLVELTGAAYFANIDFWFMLEESTRDMFRSVVYCVVWCSYFGLSKRVRNIYHTSDDEELEAVFE